MLAAREAMRQLVDDRLDRLAPFEQLSLLLTDPLGLAPVHDVHVQVVRIHTLESPDQRTPSLALTSCPASGCSPAPVAH